MRRRAYLKRDRFRCNAYLGINKDLLQSLGDAEQNNLQRGLCHIRFHLGVPPWEVSFIFSFSLSFSVSRGWVSSPRGLVIVVSGLGSTWRSSCCDRARGSSSTAHYSSCPGVVSVYGHSFADMHVIVLWMRNGGGDAHSSPSSCPLDLHRELPQDRTYYLAI